MMATPTDDGGVGDVERPEVIRPPVDVHEVDDGPDDHAIDQVAGGAAHDEGEPEAGEPLMPRQPGRIDRRPRRWPPIAMTAMTTVLSGKSAAFRKPNAAPVFRTCVKFMNPGTTSTLELQRHQRPYQRLGELIEHDDGHRQPELRGGVAPRQTAG